MSKGKRYTEESTIEAVKLIAEGGYSVQEVAERLGISTKSLYHWRSQWSGNKTVRQSSDDSVRVAKLEAKLKRVSKERGILKKAARYFASHPE